MMTSLAVRLVIFLRKQMDRVLSASPEGPVLRWDDEQRAVLSLGLIERAMENEALAAGAMALRIEPRLHPPLDRALRTFKRGTC